MVKMAGSIYSDSKQSSAMKYFDVVTHRL